MPMFKKRSVIAVPTFISLGLMGAFHAFWGTSLPTLRTFLDINIEKAALLTTYNLAGQAVACLVGGLLCDLIRRDKVLLLGCVLLGSGTFFLGATTALTPNIFVVVWMGLGCGFILSGSNALLVGMFPDRKGSIMNLHHSIYGGISLVSPLVMGYLISSGVRWQYGYGGLGCLLAAAGIFFIFTEVPHTRNGSAANFCSDAGKLLMDRNFIPLLAVSFLAIGTQIAIIFLAVTFLIEVKGLQLIEASAVLSAFFIFLFVGRLICSWLTVYFHSSKIILILIFIQLTGVFIAWQGDGAVSAAAVAISGFGCSGIFPSMLALTGTLFFELAGTSLGILASVIWVGGMTIVWVSGLLSERISLDFGFMSMVIASSAALMIFIFKYKSLIQEEKRHDHSAKDRMDRIGKDG